MFQRGAGVEPSVAARRVAHRRDPVSAATAARRAKAAGARRDGTATRAGKRRSVGGSRRSRPFGAAIQGSPILPLDAASSIRFVDMYFSHSLNLLRVQTLSPSMCRIHASIIPFLFVCLFEKACYNQFFYSLRTFQTQYLDLPKQPII